MKKERLSLEGQKFGRLTVIEYAYTDRHGHSAWRCECECGNELIVKGIHLKSGHTSSCRCLRDESARDRCMTHGKAKTRIHRTWINMKNRCNNPRTRCYEYYGGRGIRVFDDWNNSFESFYDYVSKLPHFNEDGYSLDRINNDGNYEPDNVRWATRSEQMNNQRGNVTITFNGETRTLKEWSKMTGVKYSTIRSRYYANRTPEEILARKTSNMMRL